MAKRKFEEIVADLKDQDVDEDLISELEGFAGSKLREQAEKVPELERQLAEREAQLEKLEAAPARRKAFEDYGIDLENLSKAEAKILEGYEGELDEEALGKLAEEFDLPIVQGAEREGEEEPESAVQTRQALSGAKRTSRLSLTAEDYTAWPIDKRMKFQKEHPDETEALMRGETVAGIAV